MEKSELMQLKVRDDGSKFWIVTPGEFHDSLRDAIHTLHGDVFPKDAVYGVVRDILEIEAETIDDLLCSDSAHPIYTNDISQAYQGLGTHLLSGVWDDLREYIYFSNEVPPPDPIEYEQAVVYGYIGWAQTVIGAWLLDNGFLKGD
jgi:hypothetical protein